MRVKPWVPSLAWWARRLTEKCSLIPSSGKWVWRQNRKKLIIIYNRFENCKNEQRHKKNPAQMCSAFNDCGLGFHWQPLKGETLVGHEEIKGLQLEIWLADPRFISWTEQGIIFVCSICYWWNQAFFFKKQQNMLTYHLLVPFFLFPHFVFLFLLHLNNLNVSEVSPLWWVIVLLGQTSRLNLFK